MAFYLASILNAGAFFGCYALGIVADAGQGFFDSLIITCFASAVVAFAWIAARTPAGIIMWTAVYGLLSGALQAIFSPCISLLAPSPEVIGTWNGKSPACNNSSFSFNHRNRPLHHGPCICSSRRRSDWRQTTRECGRHELCAHAGIHRCMHGRFVLLIPRLPTLGVPRHRKESLDDGSSPRPL
jgi:hypothetical protein